MIARGLAELVALAAAAVTSVWISRVMGAEYLGLFAVAATFLAFAQTITDAGLPSLGAQLIANHPASQRVVWRDVTRVRAVGAVLGVVLGGSLLIWLDVASALRLLLVGSVLGLAVAPLNASFALVAVGAIRSVALVRTLGAVASTIVAVVFIRSDRDTIGLATLLVIPGLAYALGSTLIILRAEPPRDPLQDIGKMPVTVGAWYRRGFDYAKADISLLIYMSLDRILLFVTAGAFAVGLYEAAFRLIQPFYALSTVIRESMFLDLARALGTNHLGPTMKRWARLMFLATIPVGPFLSVHGAWVITLVYGSGFADATVPLAILGWAITIGFVSGAVVLPFLSWNLGREYGNAVFAGNVTNVAANLVLIPALGGAGAALSTVAAKIAVTAFGLGPFRAVSKVPIINWSLKYLTAAAAAAIASVAIWFASDHELVSILVFAVAYGASLALMDWPEARLPRMFRSHL